MNGAMIKIESFLSSWNRATGACAESLSPRAMPRPQPSLRIPVTPANREHLRKLRAAESAAWEMPASGPSERDGVAINQPAGCPAAG